MSNKSLIALVAGVIVVLALPLIPQLLKPTGNQQTDDGAQRASLQEVESDVAAAPNAPPQPATPQPAIMTQAQFNQIRPGMTYAQCVQVAGCEGEHAPLAGGGDQYTWQIVDHPGDTISAGEATVKFRDGVVYGIGYRSSQGRRAQSSNGLVSSSLPAQRPARPPYICRPVYDAIKNGATYTECAQLLGMEGTYQGRQTMSGGTFSANGTPIPTVADVYVWHNPTIPATLALSFRDGKLTARQVSGSGSATGSFGGGR